MPAALYAVPMLAADQNLRGCGACAAQILGDTVRKGALARISFNPSNPR